MKVGLEIHQQLDTHKLFCSCKSELSDNFDFEFVRFLRPAASELGKVDRAALGEFEKRKKIIYKGSFSNSCAVEMDEEPPHEMNKEALEIALKIAKLFNARVVDEIHVMRKIILDGSVVSGFQRTALIATDGEIEGIKIQTICLEEDSARLLEEGKDYRVFAIDRLGIPLIEIATAPEIRSPEQALQVAKKIGEYLRMVKVKRGLGTIRQDLNVSVEGGARVEIKGVQELELIPKIIKNEVSRQKKLIELKPRLSAKVSEIKDVSEAFKGTECRILKNKKVFAFVIKDQAGLFAEKLHAGKHLGKEIAEYVKAWGERGFMHTDEELGKYGIKKEEIKAMRALLGASEKDLIVFATSKRALELVKERLAELAKGVPEETRKALPDGSTCYLRPLPTGARMYPETDIPPIKPFDVEAPEKPEERLKRLKSFLPEQIAKKLYLSEDYWLFEELGSSKEAALVVTELLPALRREGIKPSEEHLKKLVKALESRKIDFSGAKEYLLGLMKGKVEQLSEEDVLKIIRRIINERRDFALKASNPEKGIMGLVMKEVRGRFPGSRVFELVRREIERLKKGS